MTAPYYGSRRISITSLARAKLKREEANEVYETCRTRGFRLSLSYSPRERGYVAILTAGSTVYEALAGQPIDAFRKALALRDGPPILSVLTGPES